MAQISVIVPVYKVEKYIEQCVGSLISQTAKDFEIILVNDGSPDRCPDICDAYLVKYPQLVKVVHQPNLSQNVAWNNGLSIASGAWITFVDSDDWVEPDMIEIMLAGIEKDDADIHAFGHYKEYRNITEPFLFADAVLTEDEKANIIYRKKTITLEAWGKLFRRSLIKENNLRFYPGHFHHEDAIFNVKAFCHAKKVRLHQAAFYHYRMVGSGYMLRWDLKKVDAYYLYINRYSEFVDGHFSGLAAARMKQKVIVEQLRYIGDLYADPRGALSRREIKNGLKKIFYAPPFDRAIKEYPLSELPPASAFGIFLLRMHLIAAWLDTYQIFLKLLARQKNIKTYEKFD